MALIISQGPLPFDGDRVAADVFLEAWVNGTTIGGLDVGSFAESVSFVVSQTEGPFQRRGLFWFKRGEGTLYFREEADRCDSRYTTSLNEVWLSIAPMRSIFLEVQKGGQIGGGCHLGEEDTFTDGLSAYFSDCKGRRIPFYRSNTLGMGIPTKIGLHTAILSNTSGSGLPSPAFEWGFVNALIASGGSNVARGAFAKLNYLAVSNEVFYFHPRTEAWTGETNFGSAGVIVETNATSVSHLALIFKRPGLDYGWRVGHS